MVENSKRQSDSFELSELRASLEDMQQGLSQQQTGNEGPAQKEVTMEHILIEEPAVSKEQLEIMLHTLGLNDPYRKESYRNYFVASSGHSDLPAILWLVSLGMMVEKHAPGFLENGDRVFHVTDKGKEYCRINRERPSLAKRRYHMYLEVSDLDPDLTFKEFLTSPYYADARARA